MSKKDLLELKLSTLSSYARKAAGQANKAGGVAKSLDKKAAEKEGEFYKNSNVPDPKVNYTGDAKPYADLAKARFAGVKKAKARGADVNPGNMESVVSLLDAILEGNTTQIENAFKEAISSKVEQAMLEARMAVAEELGEAVRVMGKTSAGDKMTRYAKGESEEGQKHRDETAKMVKQARAAGKTLRKDTTTNVSEPNKYGQADKQVMKYSSKDVKRIGEETDLDEATFKDVTNWSPRSIQKMGHSDGDEKKPFVPKKVSDGYRRRRSVTSNDDTPEDVPHTVSINGKSWKTFATKSHAANVAKKIKGATVERFDPKAPRHEYSNRD